MRRLTGEDLEVCPLCRQGAGHLLMPRRDNALAFFVSRPAADATPIDWISKLTPQEARELLLAASKKK